MRFIVSKKRLVTALRSVGPAVASRSALPALAGIRVEASKNGITLDATDLEATARHHLSDAVRIEDPGQSLVPAKQLAKAAAAMPGDEISIESTEVEGRACLALHAGTRSVSLETLPIEDFPTLPNEDGITPLASAAAGDLADTFARAVLCASRDEARPVLTSVALLIAEGSPTLELIATDSYRMGIIRQELDAPAAATRTLLVPSRILKELAKQMRKARGSATIGIIEGGGGTVATFRFGATLWNSRLVEGDFPNWQQIVPPEDAGASVEFETAEMASALKSVEAMAATAGTPVRLKLGDVTTLTLIDGGTTAIHETLTTAKFTPDGVGEIETAFSPAYLADGMRFIGRDRARMCVRDGLKPALIGRDDRRYVLMPVRLS